jgi:outer membrane biosynthesis protein TonB
MNDDRLVGMLAALRTERMERTADQELRTRLENAWTVRETRSGLVWRLRRPVLVVATAALVFGSIATTLSAPGDSALYTLRVTIEDLAITLHRDPEDRAEYLVSLLEQRTAEAARLEATGNALAASHVRDIERDTLRMVQQNLPVAPDVVEPAPTESPSPSPTPSPTASPTASPTPTSSPAPTATQRPATPRPTTASPAATIKPTATPTPKPTTAATPQAVSIAGAIKNPDGTYATNVCVQISPNTSCSVVTTSGSFRVTFSAKIGQSVTLNFLRSDGIKTYKATITKTITSTYIDVGIVVLRVQ